MIREVGEHTEKQRTGGAARLEVVIRLLGRDAQLLLQGGLDLRLEIVHASRIPTSPSKNSHLCEVHWLSGIVGLCSLLEHGRTKGTTTKKKSAKTRTTTTTTTTGVNINTFAIVRSGRVS